jgi:uncharacterized protein (DUF983 family)
VNRTGTHAKAPTPLGRAARMLGRAVLRRCPNCGSGSIFRNYLQQLPSCPACRLRLDRGERDFFIGAYTINLIAAELIVFFGGIAVIVGTWPEVPWTAVMYGLAALMVAAPIVLYPLSRQLWLAFDLIFRPAETSDFEDGTGESPRPDAAGAGHAGVDNRLDPGRGDAG